MDTVSIYDGREVPAAKLLAALYNGTRPLGLGVFAALSAPNVMTEAEARKILNERGSFGFDYLWGRPLKVYARNGVIPFSSILLYDRDAGEGAFERAVAEALG